jgi:hypothetical protein
MTEEQITRSFDRFWPPTRTIPAPGSASRCLPLAADALRR